MIVERDEGFQQYPFFIPPPHCPKAVGIEILGYPSSAFVMVLLFLSSLSFFITCASKYHTIKVFNKVISTPITSNTWWCVYFAFVSVWAAFASVKFALPIQDASHVTVPFAIINLVLYGLIPFSLCCALAHQPQPRRQFTNSRLLIHRHDSPAASKTRHTAYYPASFQQEDEDSDDRHAFYGVNPRRGALPSPHSADPLVRCYQRCCSLQLLNYLLFALLLLLYWIFMGLSLGAYDTSQEAVFYYLFVLVFAIQRLPIFLLACRVLLDASLPYYGCLLPDLSDGPSRTSKIYLLVGVLLSVFDLVPISMWDQVFGGNHCPFWLFSWVDFFELLYVLSIIFFFLFTRSEYFRGLEHELWFGEQTARYATYNPGHY
jgi:hypothetical protein